MNLDAKKQSELSAVLDLVTYLDTKEITANGPITLKQLVEDYVYFFEDNAAFQVLAQAVDNNDDYGNIEIINQSSTNNSSEWTDDLIQACTFRDSEGNYYVAYRGTGDGRWVDNGNGMTEPSTEMQEAAAAYFDEMAEKYLIDASNQGKDIIVTGHSKGGNEAQYTYMAARHEEIIDKCISIDGQGFSEDAIEIFQNRFGDEYDDKLANMYSINGENDFVHDLGIVIIPEENTYFVPTSGDSFSSLHDLNNMLTDDEGEYTGLNWYMEDGQILYGKQGEIGELAKKISENMMELESEDLNGAAIAVMSIIDPYSNDEILGSIDVSWTDYVDLIAHGVPAVIETLFTTSEGWSAITTIVPELFGSLHENYGVGGVVGGVVVAAFGIALATYLVPRVVVVFKVLDFVIDTVNQIIEVGERIAQFISDVKDAVVATVNRIAEKIQSYSSGYKYATANPQIEVDTYKLCNYAQRLQAVNRRISNLDSRLDSLYWRVGLLDLWNLMQADILTGYSWRLSRCASYLSDTATDFVNAENDLVGKLQ